MAKVDLIVKNGTVVTSTSEAKLDVDESTRQKGSLLV